MNDKEIRSYEAMAKIDLPEAERDWILSEANRLEERFSALDSFDTAEIEPLVTVLNLQSVLRDDKNSKAFPREEVLAGAPEQTDGYFQVPRTLE